MPGLQWRWPFQLRSGKLEESNEAHGHGSQTNQIPKIRTPPAVQGLSHLDLPTIWNLFQQKCHLGWDFIPKVNGLLPQPIFCDVAKHWNIHSTWNAKGWSLRICNRSTATHFFSQPLNLQKIGKFHKSWVAPAIKEAALRIRLFMMRVVSLLLGFGGPNSNTALTWCQHLPPSKIRTPVLRKIYLFVETNVGELRPDRGYRPRSCGLLRNWLDMQWFDNKFQTYFDFDVRLNAWCLEPT